MRAPAFWSNSPDAPGWQSRLLSPLGFVYAAGTARRIARTPEMKRAIPVICVGNINAGGTGKTPTVIALIEQLHAYRVHVVTRGYGGTEQGPIQVNERKHKASEVGDEPLLIAAFAPTWVAKDRATGITAAEQAGAQVILMDDGLQNPSVAKTLSIVVVDAALGFGNGRVIPAGPLREPVKQGLKRADILLSIGDEKAQAMFTLNWGNKINIPHISASLQVLPMGINWEGQRVMAFAGIGYPEKFFSTLRGLGAEVLRAEALTDHQPLTDALMKRLEMEAHALSAQLVTTEKDAVRLPSSFRKKVLTLPVRLQFDDETALNDALSRLPLNKA
ncbi:MAG: tetraacyldisaccharide 4'-kinase [Boseongicola sp.]|nr:tetraacyldisaccharide 4'-kinase [Boseongicola sp.]